MSPREVVVTCAGRLHDAPALAVRLDIRPRLTLPDRPVVARRRLQLPPLALPAVGYWAFMAGLTYVLLHVGSYPFEGAATAAPEPARVEQPGPEPQKPQLESATLPSVAEPREAESELFAPAATPAPRDDQPTPPDTFVEPSKGTADPSTQGLALGAARTSSARPRIAETAASSSTAGLALSFPEFTDGTRPPERTHAADGPRIESLFEPAQAPSSQPREETPPPAEQPREPTSSVSSCEAAVARNNEELRIGAAPGTADVSREAYAAILQDGRYLTRCNVPERTVFEICAAVKGGRAVGVTVVSSPSSAALNACVRSAVTRLRFPESPRLDVTHTRFDAVRR